MNVSQGATPRFLSSHMMEAASHIEFVADPAMRNLSLDMQASPAPMFLSPVSPFVPLSVRR